MPNLYRAFTELLPASVVRVGDVQSVDGQRVTVQWIGVGGGVVYGDGYQVGDRVLVSDAQVVRKLPTLPVVAVEI